MGSQQLIPPTTSHLVSCFPFRWDTMAGWFVFLALASSTFSSTAGFQPLHVAVPSPLMAAGPVGPVKDILVGGHVGSTYVVKMPGNPFGPQYHAPMGYAPPVQHATVNHVQPLAHHTPEEQHKVMAQYAPVQYHQPMAQHAVIKHHQPMIKQVPVHSSAYNTSPQSTPDKYARDDAESIEYEPLDDLEEFDKAQKTPLTHKTTLHVISRPGSSYKHAKNTPTSGRYDQTDEDSEFLPEKRDDQQVHRVHVHQAPVRHARAHYAPVHHTPVHHTPVHHAPVMAYAPDHHVQVPQHGSPMMMASAPAKYSMDFGYGMASVHASSQHTGGVHASYHNQIDQRAPVKYLGAGTIKRQGRNNKGGSSMRQGRYEGGSSMRQGRYEDGSRQGRYE